MGMDAIGAGKTALVTGGAAGIGLATAQHLARAGMNIVVIDLREELFDAAEATLRADGAAEVWTRKVDVSDLAAIKALEAEVKGHFGGVNVLMCNAGMQPGSDIFNTSKTWDKVLAVNLGGVVSVCQVFVPGMMERGAPGLVINTGSKQGITTPPGDPAYNVSKAGVKVFTEALQHHLRESGSLVSAHLLVPGFVFTDLTRRDRTEKPDGAWTPEQTADFLFESLAKGDFYIICPDNDVTREVDEKRMDWAMHDIIDNRPPLSRWHKDWAEAFEAYAKGN
ncbi:SDR family NAD(P)-dependent oxidoreductase [Flavimaricola marinus]|uniref:3-oxoacyl-[acyl-carrier-protein] reductase FabG n=1 Tax=Flavimaricola marinus TaxID=1819565 RepID=A0A238LDB1_9RHOB|nr:SDR family NAD(P)-dependent oxidoreductase [Flavimaricola marinus]SMY07572.1 3-oxoacyl-[acyl-carrier-protein] reductase FabG [Flavimaricola marinus]